MFVSNLVGPLPALGYWGDPAGNCTKRIYKRKPYIIIIIPASVYISEEYGGPSDFPNEDGKFPSLETANSGMTFKVDGDPTSTEQTQREPQRQQLGIFRRFGQRFVYFSI